MPRRRNVLASGAAAVALGLAGAGYRAWDRGIWSGGEGPAYAAWQDWQGTAADGIVRPLRAAILAANPHDTQPWRFAVSGSTIILFADRARHLGTFDPFRREMHLGLGAAVENLVLRARALGFAAAAEPVDGTLPLAPDTTPVPVARIMLTPGAAAPDVLAGAIPRRHTNRGPYRADQPIAAATLQRLADAAGSDTVRVVFVTDRQARAELGAVIVEATARIVGDPQMSADSAYWFRTGRRAIAAHRDGVTVDTAGASALLTAASKLLPDLDAASADRYWLAATRDTQVPTAPVLGLVLVRDRLDMRSAIQAGRAWQRLHLAATVAGIAAQPLNQPIECIDRDAMLGRAGSYAPALAALVPLPGWHPTFMFRMGVAERDAGVSPRRALHEVLLPDA